jgi:hypothetical protein
MSFLNPNRQYPQKATYWSRLAGDGFGSEGGWDAPLVIECRWESVTDEQLSSFYAPAGEIELSRSWVFTKTRLETGNYLYLGIISSVLPVDIKGAFVIRTVNIIPGIRADYFEYSVGL